MTEIILFFPKAKPKAGVITARFLIALCVFLLPAYHHIENDVSNAIVMKIIFLQLIFGHNFWQL